jgi:hypothetical protein
MCRAVSDADMCTSKEADVEVAAHRVSSCVGVRRGWASRPTMRLRAGAHAGAGYARVRDAVLGRGRVACRVRWEWMLGWVESSRVQTR